MAAAVAAVALVASVAATGSDFVIAQIEGVGSNLVYAYYEAGGNISASEADYIQLDDVDAVRARLGSLAAAVVGVTTSWDSIAVDGAPMQIRILGSSEEYRSVRNLQVHAGRFLERSDLASRAKVCLVTSGLATSLFGDGGGALGRNMELHGLDFRVIGVFFRAGRNVRPVRSLEELGAGPATQSCATSKRLSESIPSMFPSGHTGRSRRPPGSSARRLRPGTARDRYTGSTRCPAS